MLDSTVSVLNYYIDIPYYHINSIDAFRVDIEDTVYLVETEEGAVAIYETDYFISLDAAVQTLHKIAEENGYTFEALQSAKDVPNEFITRSDDKRFKFILARINSTRKISRINPLTYGNQ